MRCPACGEYSSDDTMKVARHMMGKFDKTHTDWMQAHKVNPLELLGVNKKGDYKLLAEILDRIEQERR